MKRQGFEEVIK